MNIIEINQNNLIHNFEFFKKRTKAKICAMVKANGYGHDAKTVAQILCNKVDYFGVNNLSEAIEIREVTNKPILVVGVCEERFDDAVKYGVDLTVYNVESLQAMLSTNLPIRVHIAVNTGMNRLGFRPEEVKSVVDKINQSNLLLIGVFTHFATADSDKKYFDYQVKQFKNALNSIDTSGLIIHASNTSALKYPSIHYDMVRLGIGLYGYGQKGLRPVMRVKSKVVALHQIEKNESVGYGRGYVANEPCEVAVIPLGYADGINRHLARKIFVKINSKPCFVVSNICMDMFMVKVPKGTKIGDEVIIMDNADIWANELKTINYEVLTAFNHKRFDINVTN